MFIDFDQKWLERIIPGIFLFAYCFDPFVCTLQPISTVRPTSARNHFSHFKKEKKECIHTCTFYLGKPYKCAVTVFTILAKIKFRRKKTKKSNAPRLDFEVMFAHFGSPLPPFGLHLDRFRQPVRPISNLLRCVVPFPQKCF